MKERNLSWPYVIYRIYYRVIIFNQAQSTTLSNLKTTYKDPVIFYFYCKKNFLATVSICGSLIIDIGKKWLYYSNTVIIKWLL